jgi:3-hydroxyacyl-CoA dehydrogenase / enoyl-CoA hydratase / 3-hydroxybutyryl-CoA epimerase
VEVKVEPSGLSPSVKNNQTTYAVRGDVNDFQNFTVNSRQEDGKKVTLVEFHTQNRPVNILTFEFMQEFSELLEIPEVLDSDFLVLTSKMPGIFLAGADITMIEKITQLADARDKAQSGKEIFSKFRNVKGKTIAWVNGTCLGGGCEMTLFCDVVVMDKNPKYKIGLPETKLGIIPGFGGTVLLPRKVGVKEGLGMILKGGSLPAKKAARIRLVDAVVSEGARPTVAAFQAAIARQKKKRPNFIVSGIMSALTPLIVMMARRQVEKHVKNYPALGEACHVVRRSYFLPESRAFEIENESFAKLAISQTSKNLIRIFYMSEEAKKLGKLPKGTPPISNLGVIGGGVMGVGIALSSAKSKISTRVKDLKIDILKNSVVSNKKMSKKVWHKWVPDIQKYLHVQTDSYGFKNLDCVVEAVFEDVKLKRKIFADLEDQVSEECILASNTSSLPLADIEKNLKHKERFAGLHFFNPVLRMPLVEIVKASKTSEVTIQKLCALVLKMGKVPLVCTDTSGFVVNRILGFYLNEGVHLLADGVAPDRMEKLARGFGLPMGPLRLLDEIGIDIAIHVSKILDEKHGGRYAPRGGLDLMATADRLGRKSGKGFYIYGGKKKETLDEDWCKKFRSQLSDFGGDVQITDEDIIHRLILPMVAEGCRLIHEGVVDHPDWIDVGMVFGTGFPPYRGGLMRYAKGVGATTIMDRLAQFERTYEHAARFSLGKEREVLLSSL